MPPRLAPGEDTTHIQLKVPRSLKTEAQAVADEVAEGDLSFWIRDQMRKGIATHRGSGAAAVEPVRKRGAAKKGGKGR